MRMGRGPPFEKLGLETSMSPGDSSENSGRFERSRVSGMRGYSCTRCRTTEPGTGSMLLISVPGSRGTPRDSVDGGTAAHEEDAQHDGDEHRDGKRNPECPEQDPRHHSFGPHNPLRP